MNTAWNFATIAFQPYPDVGEFVNVGVLAVAVPDRLLAYRLLPATVTKRIHDFFPELDVATYKEGRKRIEAELQRLESVINSTQSADRRTISVGPGQDPLISSELNADALFRALTAPRDGLFRFHAKGSRLAPSVESLLDALFDRYISRNTAEAEDTEELRLVHELDSLLEKWKLRRLYRKDVRVGTDAFHVRFPFGYQPDEAAAPQRVIKPLNLSRTNSTQIYQHGDMWVANLTRLRKLHVLPDRVLLPVRMPLATRGASREVLMAADEVRELLAKTKVTIADAGDKKALREFADIGQESTLILTA